LCFSHYIHIPDAPVSDRRQPHIPDRCDTPHIRGSDGGNTHHRKIRATDTFCIPAHRNHPLNHDNKWDRATAQIRYAQIARGLDTRHNMFRTASTTITPMIRESVNTADELATAMESRCYQGNFRTSLFELKMRAADWGVLCGIGGLVILSYV
jgi:hypothetical protein